MITGFNPPTDNLYKFIAIAGLVCFVIGVVLAVQTTQKTLDLAYSAEDEIQKAWLALGERFKDGDDETAFEMLNEAWEKATEGENPFGLTQEVRTLGTLKDEQIGAVRRFEIAAETFGDQHHLQQRISTWLDWMMGVSLESSERGSNFLFTTYGPVI